MTAYNHLLDRDRMALFERLGRRIQRFAKDTPLPCYVNLRSDETEMRVRGEGMTDALHKRAADIFPLLSQLAAISPLEKGPELQEILEVEIHGHSGYAYLVVRNAIGEEEHVTTMSPEPRVSHLYDLWCSSRETTTQEDTPWDRARGERRLVRDHGRWSIIDPGVLHVIDLITAAGGRTTSSCEGHPYGAYIAMHRDPVVAQVFKELGWDLEEGGGIVRMPMPRDVADRDRMWREASARLEQILAPGMATRRP